VILTNTWEVHREGTASRGRLQTEPPRPMSRSTGKRVFGAVSVGVFECASVLFCWAFQTETAWWAPCAAVRRLCRHSDPKCTRNQGENDFLAFLRPGAPEWGLGRGRRASRRETRHVANEAAMRLVILVIAPVHALTIGLMWEGIRFAKVCRGKQPTTLPPTRFGRRALTTRDRSKGAMVGKRQHDV